MKPKGIFVITSVYHIFLSILHIEEKKMFGSTLVIVEMTPNIKSLKNNLENSDWFEKVVFLAGRENQKKIVGKHTYTFNKKKTVKLLDNNNEELKNIEHLTDTHQMYICSPDSSKNYFIHKYSQQDLYMIEDGLKTYIVKPPSNLKKLINIIINKPLKYGFDKRIKKVFASDPEKLPNALRLKSEKLNWKATFKTLNSSKKEELIKVFIPNNNFDITQLFNHKASKTLIITQPLNEDGLIASEGQKIDIYLEFINKAGTDIIYIKPHPRELTNYKTAIKTQYTIEVLPRIFPVELLNLVPELYFIKGFTAFSTGLDNLRNIKEKISLGLKHFK